MSNFPGFGDVQGIIVKIAYAKVDQRREKNIGSTHGSVRKSRLGPSYIHADNDFLIIRLIISTQFSLLCTHHHECCFAST